MKPYKKLSFFLLLTMLVSTFGACNQSTTNKPTDSDEFVATTSGEYPMDTDVTLRYWMLLNPAVSATNTSMNTTELKKYLEEATGVKIAFEHPVTGQETAALNIMQSSGNVPDIIDRSWQLFPGGPQKAIDEGFLLRLNPYIESVSPNLKKLFDENPEWKSLITTNEGSYYVYPFIRPDTTLATFMSFIVRKDLLDKAGLDIPETIDEWEQVLYTFKDMGVKSPLGLRLGTGQFSNFSSLTGLFGFAGTFFHVDGTIKYGPSEDGFKDYVKLLARWYTDGILDKEFVDEDINRRAAMVTNGENGIIDATIGGEFGNYLSAIPPESGIEYVALRPPVKNKGDRVMWTQKDWPLRGDGAAISADSKHKEIAARFLDFGYSEEGHMIYNFGKESVSYEFRDGERGKNIPTYTDIVVNKEKNGNLSVAQGMAKHIRAVYNGPFTQNVEYIFQYYSYKAQKDALETFDSDTLKYKLPPIFYTEEESKQYTDIMTPLETYQNETMIKLITGRLELDYLDTYYAELQRMGIDKAIEIVQAAYNRYLQRAAY